MASSNAHTQLIREEKDVVSKGRSFFLLRHVPDSSLGAPRGARESHPVITDPNRHRVLRNHAHGPCLDNIIRPLRHRVRGGPRARSWRSSACTAQGPSWPLPGASAAPCQGVGPMTKALSAHRDRCVVARQYEPLAPATCEHLGSVLCHMPGLSGASRGAFAADA